MISALYANKHFLCVRWGAVTRVDLDEVLARARSIERAEGRKLVYAGLQYDDTPLPDRDVSKIVIDRAIELAACCERFYIVVAATGVAGSLHRTGIRSMLTLARIAGARVERVRVMDSVDAMLDDAEPLLPAPRATLRAALTSLRMP